MVQSSLLPGMRFHSRNSAHVGFLPVRCWMVCSPERQYVSRTSTSTPSTSKIRILGSSLPPRIAFLPVFATLDCPFLLLPVYCTRQYIHGVSVSLHLKPLRNKYRIGALTVGLGLLWRWLRLV